MEHILEFIGRVYKQLKEISRTLVNMLRALPQAIFEFFGRAYRQLSAHIQALGNAQRLLLAFTSFVVVFALFDGVNVGLTYRRLKLAAREATRFAVTMQPQQNAHYDNSPCQPSELCYEETANEYLQRRVQLIKGWAIAHLTGEEVEDANLMRLAKLSEAYNVEVWGSPDYGAALQRDHPGLGGMPVRVSLEKNWSQSSLLFGVILPQTSLKAAVEMINEGIQVGVGDRPPPVSGNIETGQAPPVSQNGPAGSSLPENNTSTLVTKQQYLIKTAAINMQLENTAKAHLDIAQIAEAYDGYVAQQKIWNDGEANVGHIEIAVPHENLDQAFAEIRNLADLVVSEELGTQDVSETYVDLESRLRNQQATQERVLNLLEQAETVEEALMVSREVSEIEEKIEQLQGQLNHLNNQIVYSVIAIDVRPLGTEEIEDPYAWKLSKVVERAFASLVGGMQGLVGLLVWAGIVGLPAFLCVYVLFRIAKALTRRKPKAGEAETETPE